ncbi:MULTISPECIES: PepSY domain-containing protein [Bradyrhizobium]|jgi:peptidase YpeB-like protein|uniref:PepSY domain-containing protein n=1 Tax=Bradyrhizobium TaxID=374 RepID=UPI0004802FA9|nr:MULTISPECIES: PepSY domain-containing protein [Bradyrhizobium]MCS3449086.1 putative small secreted protein [Bradyrhizobium elkanii]MCS3559771.1 putative small secreted protein [Bradyrhizobium elkanii]MCW2150383.1 putative small secreted protein [Bradyrhizobium elkanii]MCW2359559.1 putative small secreted protein [Bradyrhizobium elkanii]MCW2374114.1 putative small secreted protein [Bradyrhizobium elkanii]
MRSFIIPAIAALAIGAATPAMAYDSGSQISMEAALDVATNLGIVTVSNTQFLGDEWEIEGRDRLGRWMQVDVDARTGEVRNVDRGW